MSRVRRLGEDGSDDPLHGVANFFDVGIVFALGFMLALLAHLGVSPTVVAEDARSEAPEVPDDAVQIERFRVSADTSAGEGVRLGTAYRLSNGDVVYVPDDP